MKVKVSVTKDVLNRSKNCGVLNRSKNCMIAIAIRDLFPTALIGNPNFTFFAGFDGLPETLPKIACRKILQFDKKTPEERVLMTPFSFEIEVPEYVIERIGISTIYKVLSESSTLEMVM